MKKITFILGIIFLIIAVLCFFKWDQWQVEKVVKENINALNEQDHHKYTSTLTATVQDNTSVGPAAALFMSNAKAKFEIITLNTKKQDKSTWIVRTKQKIIGMTESNGDEKLDKTIDIDYHIKDTEKGWKISWYELSEKK
ncbi:hypothetical protein [Bacillus cereus]|jgi:hypothetical protein|uniref:hypothetical protein n=1 Tax=Bacillus cereus TaxID=1396 RepID=UPI0001A1864B|nr:hypothetical protein [Bacillus cereus]ALL11669.1 hypothetical protein BTXL6_27745 [Bacillus thuringiensis]EEM19138.1 hypothetical protein bthur0001_57770 [Bacillus thuringiensis serovar tochigiensis BGSC 4Y1]ALL21808.1 hypothetical protein BTXL6_10180 [Bacillus thuringiensis]EJR72644.1 hypothetical protein IK9_05419 [Bacillus cereus VD166]TKH75748.1 hypothetical protein FC676_05300 [Bacillus cereus]